MPRGSSREMNRLDQLQFARGNMLAVNQLRSLIDELRHYAYCDFGNTLRANFDAHRARDALKLFSRGDFFFREMLEDCACFASAADHADEEKWLMNPILED